MSNTTPAQEQLLAQELDRVAELREREARQQQAIQSDIDQLVAQIQEVRQALDQAATKVMTLGQELKRQAKKAPEMAGAHTIFIQGHMRMAGAVQQVVRRTSMMDRTLLVAKKRQEEESVRATDQELESHRRAFQHKIEAMSVNPISALSDLFGEEFEE